jgi:hypothetical protein
MTKCWRGHPQTPENVYVAPDGSPRCRPCKARHSQAARARVRGESPPVVFRTPAHRPDPAEWREARDEWAAAIRVRREAAARRRP